MQSIPISKVTAKNRAHAEFGTMDLRVFLIPKREHPQTIKANEARSTRKLVAVMLITEYMVHLTQQSRKKTLIARKS